MESKMSFLSNRVSYATIPLSINVETVKAKRWRYLGKLRQQSHVPGLVLPAVRWVFLRRFHPSLNKLYATGYHSHTTALLLSEKRSFESEAFNFKCISYSIVLNFGKEILYKTSEGKFLPNEAIFFLVSVLIRKLQQTSY